MALLVVVGEVLWAVWIPPEVGVAPALVGRRRTVPVVVVVGTTVVVVLVLTSALARRRGGRTRVPPSVVEEGLLPPRVRRRWRCTRPRRSDSRRLLVLPVRLVEPAVLSVRLVVPTVLLAVRAASPLVLSWSLLQLPVLLAAARLVQLEVAPGRRTSPTGRRRAAGRRAGGSVAAEGWATRVGPRREGRRCLCAPRRRRLRPPATPEATPGLLLALLWRLAARLPTRRRRRIPMPRKCLGVLAPRRRRRGAGPRREPAPRRRSAAAVCPPDAERRWRRGARAATRTVVPSNEGLQQLLGLVSEGKRARHGP